MIYCYLFFLVPQFQYSAEPSWERTGHAEVPLTAAEYTSEVIEQSEFYLSPEAVREIISQEQRMNSKAAQRVFVCYGRPSVELGEIWLPSGATYREGKDLVRHLVAAYLAGVDDAAIRSKLVGGFGLFDPAGKVVVTEDDLNVRYLWLLAAVIVNYFS